MKEDFSDEDGIRAAEPEGEFAERWLGKLNQKPPFYCWWGIKHSPGRIVISKNERINCWGKDQSPFGTIPFWKPDVLLLMNQRKRTD